jgi:NAD(P)-dependent dehydrogenase (short-subunit alcohol dehydrogenase family)
VQALQTNVTQESEVGNLVVLAQTRFERIDIMVNCAGILRSTRIQAISKAEWDLVLDVNLNGTFLCTQAVLGTMKARGYGRIVNLASLAGRSVSTLGGAHYTASKAGVIGLTRAVAKEMGPFGITVNAICPGVVDTDMPNNIASSDQLAAVAASLPIPRMGTAEEIADLAYFIIAKAPYINGAAIDINGGGLMI